MKNLSKLHTKYIDLMAQADAALSRKQALDCIHKATKIREQIELHRA